MVRGSKKLKNTVLVRSIYQQNLQAEGQQVSSIQLGQAFLLSAVV